jgi:type IV secretory pathway component VirB8
MRLFGKSRAVVPVTKDSLPDFMARVPQVQLKAARRERRFGNAKSALILLLLGYAGWKEYRYEQMAKIAAENANRAIYVTLRDDGTLTNSVVFTALPQHIREDNTLNTLWNYVYWRECYSRAEAPRAKVAVQRMSDNRVRREWLEAISESNPKSPHNTHGKQGKHYECEIISYTPVGSENNRYAFRFMRYEVDKTGRRDRGISMTAPVGYRTGVYPTEADGWKDKVTFNAPGLQVWEYQGARPDAVQEHLRPRNAVVGSNG